MQFDDEVAEPPDPAQATRAVALAKDPERQAMCAVQFDASARATAALGVSFGQTRGAFVSSMAEYYDVTRKAFEVTIKAQLAAAAAPANEAPSSDAPPPVEG